jgi:hypothetical protein
MKENWSLPKDPPSSREDLLPVLGMEFWRNLLMITIIVQKSSKPPTSSQRS